MTPEQFERLETQLQSLEPEVKRMNDNARQFVRDQIERVERFGINVRMSPKQQDWLDSLYTKLVGPLDALPNNRSHGKEEDRRDTLGEDDDDDTIPF
jgi:hypothetical protein